MILYQTPHHSRIWRSKVSGLESPESYGSGYKFGVAKGVVEDLDGILEFRVMMFLRGHHFVSFFKIRWLVLCHHSVFWLFRLGLQSLISTPTFVFFIPSFSTNLLLLYQAVFVLSAIVCTVSDNWFKFWFATLVQR